MKIGMVTVGQSPRNDVISEVRGILGGLEIVEMGCLDLHLLMDAGLVKIDKVEAEKHGILHRLSTCMHELTPSRS